MPFLFFVGRQFGQFAAGCYEGFCDGARNRGSETSLSIDPMGASEAGKRAINEALRTRNPDKIVDTIQTVCSSENLNKVSCAHAIYYCSKSVLEGARVVIKNACMNHLY